MNIRNKKVIKLQEALVKSLKDKQYIRSENISNAFLKVPRHIFVPNVSLSEAYEDKVISTKKIKGIGFVSSSSSPTIMAIMLEALKLKRGQKVLEIGAGTGYNAAIISNVVGEIGRVVTLDLDKDIVDDASTHINTLGLNNIKIFCRDGILGASEEAPYDRIIVTVGVPSIAPAWIEQLKEGGYLVIPLEITKLESIISTPPLIVFKKINNRLESVYIQRSEFVRLRGDGALNSSKVITSVGVPGVSIITNTTLNKKVFRQALLDLPVNITTNISVSRGDLFGLHLWFAICNPDYCNLFLTDKAIKYSNFLTKDNIAYSTVGLCTSKSVSFLKLKKELNDNKTSTQLIVSTLGGNSDLSTKVIKLLYQWEKARRPFSYKNNWEMKNIKIQAFLMNLTKVGINKPRVTDSKFVRLTVKWKGSKSDVEIATKEVKR